MTVSYRYHLEDVETGKKLHTFPYAFSLRTIDPVFVTGSALSWTIQKTAESKLLEYNFGREIHHDRGWPEVRLVKEKISALEVDYTVSEMLSHVRLSKIAKVIFDGLGIDTSSYHVYGRNVVEWLMERAKDRQPINYVIVCTKAGDIPSSVKYKSKTDTGNELRYIAVDTAEDMMLIRLSKLSIIAIVHPDEGFIYKLP